jgi:hypothetical protein
MTGVAALWRVAATWGVAAWGRRRTRGWLAVAGVLAAVVGVLLATMMAIVVPSGVRGQPSPVAAQSSTKIFAFYYMWFDPDSWRRAKIDYPALGRYSSDDPNVMRQQIAWAKAAGIDGFIVSWKHTATNDRRLRLIMDVARGANFSLAMIYQGLDFNRDPLPVSTVAADFRLFRDDFAHDPVFFRVGGKPLTIWSGTWAFSHDDIATVTGPVRKDMLVLNTQKSLADYQHIADVTDGDAYYWSSVNPTTNRGYPEKLTEMSQAIHAADKYWIAPFAPGFDARLVGGKGTVDRADGATLRAEYAVAVRSSPDLLGLISWNEFSENTYVEPSRRYGSHYLDVLRDIRSAPLPAPASQDSSEGSGSGRSVWTITSWRAASLVAVPAVLLLGLTVVGVYRRRSTRSARTRAPR